MSTTSDWSGQKQYERGFGVKGIEIEIDQKQPLGKAFIDTEAAVRRRAYELYEERGRLDGFEVEDWLKAETEIQNRLKVDHSKLEDSKVGTSKLDEARLNRPELDRQKLDRPGLDRPKTDKAA
jgi:hypothetical protein